VSVLKQVYVQLIVNLLRVCILRDCRIQATN